MRERLCHPYQLCDGVSHLTQEGKDSQRVTIKASKCWLTTQPACPAHQQQQALWGVRAGTSPGGGAVVWVGGPPTPTTPL